MTVAKFAQMSDAARPVYLISTQGLDRARNDAGMGGWIEQAGFTASAGSLQLLPGPDGTLAGALFGVGGDMSDQPLMAGTLARRLPAGTWYLDAPGDLAFAGALGFALGSYRFDRYRDKKYPGARLVCPATVNRHDLERIVEGCCLARDLVNTPVNDMGPAELENGLRSLAEKHGASVDTVEGDDLLEKNLPMIHAVGRASTAAPRLLDMRWGHEDAPRITLVGKGVCFDTGGLDIKPAAGMLLMKKDMGGAANVMGLASMIMSAKLPVRLRVLIPAVENAIAGNAFRPGDILSSRKGLTVEIGNTDAEGRLVLADALSLGDEEKPDLMIDMATLTGAARVALGPDLPPYFSRHDEFAADLDRASIDAFDPLWRMPLYPPYDRNLSSPIADINNAPAGGFAGSITAALCLGRFVNRTTRWAHFDIFAWNPKDRPHAPIGGEAQAIRALYVLLQRRYGS